MAFLELSGVCKGYGDDPCAVLRDVDLTIEQGERVAIVGRSGAGKTTLLSIVAGLIPASRGAVRLRSAAVTRPGPDRAVVFQSYSLLPWLSVLDNVRLAVDRVHARLPAAQRAAKADEYVALVGLAAARDKRPAQLSGGMRQRVSVARALALEPEILLMDEPFGALDALTRAALQGEVERIIRAGAKTSLLITNDVDEAIRLGDRIVPLLAGGRLGAPVAVASGAAREVRDAVMAQLRGIPTVGASRRALPLSEAA